MSKFVPVRRQVHKNTRWLRPRNYHFAASEAVVPIVGAELANAASSMPTGFVPQNGSFHLVAVLSVSAGRDMFVAPDGRWLVGYIPAFLRAFPFRLLGAEEGVEPTLCVDEESGLLTEDSEVGEPFFNADGSISAQLSAVLTFLGECERSRAGTDLAVSALGQANLIVPWPISIQTETGARNVEGLYKIDELALNELPATAFEKLRAVGALPIAYGQLFSMNQLSVFRTLANLQAKLAPQPAPAMPDTLDKLFDTSDNAYLHFD
ncbi:SapC family protein [Rhodopseudomonas palustris]|uniref:SapC family protein n=1 Tax=Rhodopseudomonas palustris TaxID=1076 RepID=UPI000D1AE6A1|nr:SapC family protein [Rhodopseudomonas palustris]AVT82968.1 hypothetical protein RPYSC3_41080 [Rhodopseudomonas palustris]